MAATRTPARIVIDEILASNPDATFVADVQEVLKREFPHDSLDKMKNTFNAAKQALKNKNFPKKTEESSFNLMDYAREKYEFNTELAESELVSLKEAMEICKNHDSLPGCEREIKRIEGVLMICKSFQEYQLKKAAA